MATEYNLDLNGFLTNYIKADNLKEDIESFACIGVNKDNKQLNLELSNKNGEIFVFTLNVTNKTFLKEAGINSPKETLGKKITLKKEKAFNPEIKKQVDALRICKVE